MQFSQKSPHSEEESVVVMLEDEQSIDNMIMKLQELKGISRQKKIEKGSKVRRVVCPQFGGPPIGCKGVVRERDRQTAEVIWRGWYEGFPSRKGGPPNTWPVCVQELELLEDVK